MDIQTVLNMAIDDKHYARHGYARFMCIAVSEMFIEGFITDAVRVAVVAELEEYVGADYTMHGLLTNHGLSGEYEDRVAIYRDWANRPKLEHN